jgi:hypothetical protein
MRWQNEHGYGRRHSAARKARGGKVLYRSYWRAWWSCRKINRKFGDDLDPYSCRWSDMFALGETAREHWHLGHGSAQEWWY